MERVWLVSDSRKVVNTSTPRAGAVAEAHAPGGFSQCRAAHHADHSAVAVDGTVQRRFDRPHFPPSTDEIDSARLIVDPGACPSAGAGTG